MTIKVTIDNLDVTDLVQSVETSGDSMKFDRRLDLQMINTVDGRNRAFAIEEGSVVSFRHNGKLEFIGIVFDQGGNTDGSLSLVAFDANIYLSKSIDSRIFTNKKASEIITILARDFGVQTGAIADTGYVIPYLRMSNKSVYEMILTVLTITRKQTGKRYFVGNENGYLVLKEGAKPDTRYYIMAGANLISGSYSRSIADTKTQVKVIGGEKGNETVVKVRDNTKRQKYGVLQALEILDEKATPSQIKQRAETLLKEQSVVAEQLYVEVLGVPEVKTGTAVYYSDGITGAAGAYYVTSDRHTYNSGQHLMSLELTKTYELPDIEIDADSMKRS